MQIDLAPDAALIPQSAPSSVAVFLDRDGVLNRPDIRDGKPYAPMQLADFEILPGVRQALERLKHSGFWLIVVTNQPDVARGTQKLENVEAMDRQLKSMLPMIDEVRVCYHDDKDNCPCRKPKPGLLLDGMAAHGIDPSRSFMVGDRWRDIGAGQAAGCRTVFIDWNWNEKRPDPPADVTVSSMTEAADWILAEMPTRE